MLESASVVRGTPARLAGYAAVGPVRADCGYLCGRTHSVQGRDSDHPRLCGTQAGQRDSHRQFAALWPGRGVGGRDRQRDRGLFRHAGSGQSLRIPRQLSLRVRALPVVGTPGVVVVGAGTHGAFLEARRGIRDRLCMCVHGVCRHDRMGRGTVGPPPVLAVVSRHFFKQPGDGDAARPAAAVVSLSTGQAMEPVLR